VLDPINTTAKKLGPLLIYSVYSISPRKIKKLFQSLGSYHIQQVNFFKITTLSYPNMTPKYE
jgi:hypothetical protein